MPKPEKVGYKRPPKANQFKPGVSGNPRGRPKGSINAMTILRRALREEVQVRKNGKPIKINKFTIVIMQLLNQATSGNLHAMKVLLPLAMMVDEEQMANSPETLQQINEADTKTLASLVKRFEQAQKGKSK